MDYIKREEGLSNEIDETFYDKNQLDYEPKDIEEWLEYMEFEEE